MKKRLLECFIVLAATLMVGTTAFADSTPKFQLKLENPDQEGFQVFNLEIGKEAKGLVIVTNQDDKRAIDLKFSLIQWEGFAVTDAIPQDWLKFASNQVTLAPKETKKIEYLIKIPKNAKAETLKGYITATMTAYFEQKIESENADTNAGTGPKVEISMASASRIKINIVPEGAKASDVGGKEVATGTSQSLGILGFLQSNAMLIILALIAIVGISIVVRKSKEEKGSGKSKK